MSRVNHYRWVRGFNEYDNWQASGVSGEGARSFYYPAKSQSCADCHMPMTHSADAGNIAGNVHSHRFPAANTALAYINDDTAQLNETEKFLTDKEVSVDIFAAFPGNGRSGDTSGDSREYGRFGECTHPSARDNVCSRRRSGTVHSSKCFAGICNADRAADGSIESL